MLAAIKIAIESVVEKGWLVLGMAGGLCCRASLFKPCFDDLAALSVIQHRCRIITAQRFLLPLMNALGREWPQFRNPLFDIAAIGVEFLLL